LSQVGIRPLQVSGGVRLQGDRVRLITPNVARDDQPGVCRVLLAILVGSVVCFPCPAGAGAAPITAETVVGREVHPVWRSAGPNLVHRVAPHFPHKAARAGLNEGMVVVQVLIDIDGAPRDLQVIKADPAGIGFEEAAVRAVAKWRYEPLMVNDEVESVYLLVKVEFLHRRPEA
jgi:TonB family protein